MGLDPAARLRAQNLRATPQRRAILGAFRDGADEHLAAEEIYARASAQVEGISRGTVYATLAELSDLGLLASLGTQEPVRYEVNVGPHQHFRCRLCRRSFDVDIRTPSTAGLAKTGHAVESVSVIVEGVCVECQDYVRGLADGAEEFRATRQIGGSLLASLLCASHESALGPVALAASSAGLVRLAFDDHADFDPLRRQARTRRGPRAGREHIRTAIASVDRLLAGDKVQPGDPVDWAAAAPARSEALDRTRDIPWGEQRSYHQLDLDLGAYECGHVMGTNPLPLLFPCHRVTQGTSVPDAYVGGPERRRTLLDLERGG
jgi:methylated-DNA-[protein]-cysteine S-methyltransferase